MYDIKGGDSDLVMEKVTALLVKKGRARVNGFGTFKISKIKGRKRYDFKKKTTVPVESFKTIVFTAADGLREKINRK